jgi:two-component system chemotaxis response regulator CheY
MTTTFAGASALVVDDSPVMRRQLGDVLRRLGFSCDEAGDGAVAWRKLAGGGRYDVIVTDLQMPVMDGLKLIGLVRAGGAHRRTPIVVVSAEGAQADRDRAIGLGADAFLLKPVGTQHVAQTVRALLSASA